MELLKMSKKELSRVEVMERMKSKKMTQKKGAEALGVSVRQVRRLWKKYKEKGAAGLINKSRGKPSVLVHREMEFWHPYYSSQLETKITSIKNANTIRQKKKFAC